MSGFSRIASNFFADEDEEEEELVDAVRGYGVEEQREELRFRAEEVATDRVRHEADDYEVRHGWEESVRHRVDDDEARHEVDDDEGRHDEWEERLKHEADGGEVMHKELDDHELELETVRHEEEEEEVEEEWDVIGITEEVLAFATNIARHPETWLDFPLLPDDDDSDGPFSCNLFSLHYKLLFSYLNKSNCSAVRHMYLFDHEKLRFRCVMLLLYCS